MAAQTPKCLAVIICEGVVEDVRSHNKCILNTYNVIGVQSFPAQHDRLTIFASLTDGRGELPLEFRFVQDRPGGTTTLLNLNGAVKFGDPLGVIDLTVDLRGLPLKEAGNYAVQLWVNNEMIGERRIVVQAVPREEKQR